MVMLAERLQVLPLVAPSGSLRDDVIDDLGSGLAAFP